MIRRKANGVQGRNAWLTANAGDVLGNFFQKNRDYLHGYVFYYQYAGIVNAD